jgi:ubiquinone/menaquinone biosynthesis C-methylase UbiE
LNFRSSWQKLAYTAVMPLYQPIKKVILGKEPIEIIDRIQLCKDWSSALIVGGGNDPLLEHILNHSQVKQVDFVDISCTAIQHAKKQPGSRSVNFIRTNFLNYDSNEKYDVIFFPFFLDLFYDSEIRKMIYVSRKMLKKHGSLIIIDFENNGSWKQKVLISLLYLMSVPLNLRMRWRLPDFDTLMKSEGCNKVSKVLSEQEHYSINSFTLPKPKPVQNAAQWRPQASKTKVDSPVCEFEE